MSASNHIRLYNAVRKALARKDFARAKEWATDLETALKDSMNTYGWPKFSLSGDEETDTTLRRLDRYLTGDRT